ncbi:hypothetical protein WR25_17338 [Diploscapter pachys]|uniref:Poly(A) RNA polymerase mitochondrial-like central palm domain-containing protein n=1 Tax=Diploscapter pachys TaxID=2018661 RepID=A0A2A2JNM3_9BILA|nr:hypothetical protein WR25_17338 [Diploscapter pachys]
MSKKKNRKRIAALMQQQQHQGQSGQMPMPTMSNGMVIANGIPAPNRNAPNPGNSLNGGTGPKPAKRRRLEKKKKKQEMKQTKLEQQQQQQECIVLDDSGDEAPQFSDPRASTSNEENFVHIIGTSRTQVELWAREVELPLDYERTSLGVIANTALLGIFDRVKAFRMTAEPAFQRLDCDIWRHYNTNKQSVDVLQHKQSICGKLEMAIRKILRRPDARLFAVGSTVNGCGSYNSDMDLCLTLPMALPGLNPDGTPQFAKLNYDTCKRYGKIVIRLKSNFGKPHNTNLSIVSTFEEK